MAKKDLKKQNPDLEINILDLISKFDPSKTGKYTSFLVKMYRKFLNTGVNNPFELATDSFGIPCDNKFEEFLISGLYDVFGGSENIKALHEFNLHLQDNRIPTDRKDITKYDSWGELQKTVSVATLKQKEKMLEKEVIKVMDEQDWLFVRPLTFEASTSYGSGTKWCTTSNNNPDYFYRYCDRGVLVYAISRTTGEKYGLFYQNKYVDEKEFSIWDVVDVRVDSIETKIPSNLLKGIYNYMKVEKHNFFYFSKEEQSKALEYEKRADVYEEAPFLNHVEPELINLEARIDRITNDITFTDVTDVETVEETTNVTTFVEVKDDYPPF